MIKKVRHIGISSQNFEDDIKRFKDFGFKCTETINKDREGVKIAFFPVGDTLIEFVSLDQNRKLNPFHETLKRQKGIINHICFEVDDIKESIKKFQEKGAKLVEGSPRPGAHGIVAFFEPETTGGILIEICEV